MKIDEVQPKDSDNSEEGLAVGCPTAASACRDANAQLRLANWALGNHAFSQPQLCLLYPTLRRLPKFPAERDNMRAIRQPVRGIMKPTLDSLHSMRWRYYGQERLFELALPTSSIGNTLLGLLQSGWFVKPHRLRTNETALQAWEGVENLPQQHPRSHV